MDAAGGSTCAPRIIIAGAPASGKGTQCSLIKERYGVVHLSTGGGGYTCMIMITIMFIDESVSVLGRCVAAAATCVKGAWHAYVGPKQLKLHKAFGINNVSLYIGNVQEELILLSRTCTAVALHIYPTSLQQVTCLGRRSKTRLQWA